MADITKCSYKVFANVPSAVRMVAVLTFTPAGIERWFEETLERAPNEAQDAPDTIDEVVARFIAAAPRYGLEFV